MDITNTLEVRLALLLEQAGYKNHEDMDGKDFEMLLAFVKNEITVNLGELVLKIQRGEIKLLS